MRGELTLDQAAVIRPYVAGKGVVDYGAGDQTLARKLVELGASHVCAIDKEDYRLPPHRRITSMLITFRTLAGMFQPVEAVAFVSWPANNDGVLPLVSLLDCAPVAIYLGKNTDSIACGKPALFEYFLTRELLAYVPHRKNTLLILGARLASPRAPTGEEKGALSVEDPLDYEAAEL